MGSVPVTAFEAMPPTVHAELSKRGIALDSVAEIVELRAGEPLMLAGSYAVGEANPTSDLDLLVFTSTDDYRGPADSSNHPSIFGDSFDITLADLTVNLEYVPQPRFLDLCTTIAATRPSMGGPHVGNFQALELRLAQRIVTGIPLVNGGKVDELRAKLDFEAVWASAAALDLIMSMSLLEDTQVLQPPSQLLMLRGAGELLVRSAINAVGPITYDTKHLFRRATRLADRPDAPSALVNAEQLVFIGGLPVAEAVSLVLDNAEDLYRRLVADPNLQLIVQMLQPFLPSWAWTGRNFG
jgi:hypothetical protein